MGRLDKIYVNLGEVVSEFTYSEFLYFIYNLGMDYYDGLNIIDKQDWQDIFSALKENHILFEFEEKIGYPEFISNMATVLNEKFYKHRSAYEVMNDALTSFDKGNDDAKLEVVIRDLQDCQDFEDEIS